MKRMTILVHLLLGYYIFVGLFFLIYYTNLSIPRNNFPEVRNANLNISLVKDSIDELFLIAENKTNTSSENDNAVNDTLQRRNTNIHVKEELTIGSVRTNNENNQGNYIIVSKNVEMAFQSRAKVKECDCQVLFTRNNDANMTLLAKEIYRQEKLPTDYIRESKNCSQFIRNRGYITEPLTAIEKEFSIAFSILMFKAVEQSERLLRAIFRPQNLYCIHVDKNSNQTIYEAMASIANCFDNVFLTSTRYDVKWGTMTVLEPDLQCMTELYNRSKTWKYFINLTGQEFPLKTNFEMVKILQAYNGASDMEGTRKRINKARFTRAGIPPHGIVPTKGSVHIVASRAFVEFVVNDQRAKDFLEWCKNVSVPDEVFFSSLQHNPHLNISGAYKGDPESFQAEDSTEKPFLARFKNWLYWPFGWPCYGKKVRQICIIGVEDLPILYDRKELFVNKLHHDFQPIAYDCLEEFHFNRTRDTYFGQTDFDVEWYKNLGFVKNRVP